MIKVQLTNSLKMASMMLILVSALTYSWYVVQLLNFVYWPFLPNRISLLGQANSSKSNHLWNLSLYLVFWVQHYVMAHMQFKKFMYRAFKLYPVFQRYIFNNVSALLFVWILRNFEISNQVILPVPSTIYISCKIIGSVLYFGAIIQFSGEMLAPQGCLKLFKLKEIQADYDFTTKKRNGFQTNGFFKLCRNPNHAGSILLFLSTPVLTYDRLLFCMVNITAIVMGTIKQEANLERRFEDYKQYKLSNPNRFLPNPLNLIGK